MKKRIAFVYDWVDSWGGAERILQILYKEFPTADFYTSAVSKSRAPWAKEIPFQTSFIQKLPRFIRRSRVLSVLLYPFAFETFDFSRYQTVVSITSSFAKGIVTRPETNHISYIFTPTRFLWGQIDLYIGSKLQAFLSLYIQYIRRWDWVAAQRPDTLLTLSKAVQKRITETYGRSSTVLYPPFDFKYWDALHKKSQRSPEKDYYLVVSRLEPYKRVDLTIKAFRKMQDKKLVIVGQGRLKEKLEQLISPNISLQTRVSDQQLAQLYTNARALIMPQEEDFGYVALEALACHCPVIALGTGGARETVVEGKTGMFFEDQARSSLIEAIAKFEKVSYTLSQELEEAREKQLEKFDIERFIEEIRKFTN